MKTYRALFVSDLHMSNRLPHSKLSSDGVTDRLLDQMSLWDRIYKTAHERDVQMIFVLGDLFDKSVVDAITLTNTVEAISATHIPMCIIPGNHDAVYVDGGRFVVEAFNKMEIDYVSCWTGCRSAPSLGAHWICFSSLEFSTSEAARKRLNELKKSMDKRKTNVLLLHHSILGCEHNGWTCDDGLTPEEVMDGFEIVLSGHFHTPQKFFESPGRLGMYLGAPMHHRFDDQGRQAGYWVGEFREEGSYNFDFIDGGSPCFHEVDWIPGSGAKVPKAARTGDYIRIIARVTNSEWIALKSDLSKRVAELSTMGYRSSFRHVPIYHHDVRLKSSKGLMDGRRPEEMIAAYVDSPDVDTSGLDESLLKKIALQSIGTR